MRKVGVLGANKNIAQGKGEGSSGQGGKIKNERRGSNNANENENDSLNNSRLGVGIVTRGRRGGVNLAMLPELAKFKDYKPNQA